jgi:hypothetical protein
MRSPRIPGLTFLLLAPVFLPTVTSAQSSPAANFVDSKSAEPAMASLKICLRLPDESAFLGSATVRVLPEQGDELLGMATDAPGEFLFSGVTSGVYQIFIAAAGFQTLGLQTKIDGGHRVKSLFVPMKPAMATTVASTRTPTVTAPSAPTAAPAAATSGGSSVELRFDTADPSPSAPPIEASAKASGPSAEPATKDVISIPVSADPAPSTPVASAPTKEPGPSSSESADKDPIPAPDPAPAAAPSAGIAPGKKPGMPDPWQPHLIESSVPPVDPSITCPTEQILRGVQARMKEFVGTLEKFTATENLEHYSVDHSGKSNKDPERRTFAYVVDVKQNRWGTILLDEFRNGNTDADIFPAHTATRGSPAMALIFHPALAGGFEFRCEGMGQYEGRAAWQVHFVQRPDKPIQIRSYTVDGRTFPVALEGRVWLDPGNDQVLRLESELAKPIPEIGLTHEHFNIDYKPVEFHSTGQMVWLPQVAELYVERKNRRYFRRHSFTDFRLFNVDAAQNIQTPAESFSFTNSSDHDIPGELTVARREGMTGDPVVLRFVVPAHGKIFKLVGPGKDINLPVTAVGAATFVHEADPAVITVDTHLVKGASLDVVAQTKVAPPPTSSSQP